jgi:hypothetical protein
MVFFIVSMYTLNKTINISSDIFIMPKVNLVSILEPFFHVFSSKKFHSLIPGKLLKMVSLCLELLHYKRNNQASGIIIIWIGVQFRTFAPWRHFNQCG